MSITTYGFGGVGSITIMGWGLFDEAAPDQYPDIAPTISALVLLTPQLVASNEVNFIPSSLQLIDIKPEIAGSGDLSARPQIELTGEKKASISASDSDSLTPSLSDGVHVRPAITGTNQSSFTKPTSTNPWPSAPAPSLSTESELKPTINFSSDLTPSLIDSDPVEVTEDTVTPVPNPPTATPNGNMWGARYGNN